MRSEKPVRLPARSRGYGVGKEIGGAIYVHRRYESCLGPAVQAAKNSLPSWFEYTIVKYRTDTGSVSFVHSPDFDTNPEPTAGAVCVVHPGGSTRLIPPPADPFIYHHKWLFVKDEYPGFDVAASKRRSLAWMGLPSADRTHIGRRSYWVREVLPYLE